MENIIKQEILKSLLKTAEETGKVEQTDIDAVTIEVGFTPEETEEICIALREHNVEIIDSENSDLMEMFGEENSIMAEIDDESKNIVTDDPVKAYLKDIGQVQLLRSEEEISLAIRISDGKAASEKLTQKIKNQLVPNGVTPKKRDIANIIKEYQDIADKETDEFSFDPFGDIADEATVTFRGVDVMFDSEDAAMLSIIRDGQEAKHMLTNANLRLVVSIAKKYTGRGMQFLDLIQEGNLGLIKAVEKFDHTKGFKFSTYATWWIRQAITRAIADQGRTIRIPVHMVETINKVKKTSAQLLHRDGKDPTPEDIAREIGMPSEKVREILRISQEPVSLETPIGEEEDSHLGDFIPDEEAPSPADVAAIEFMKERVQEVLKTLTPREADVLRLRFGIKDSTGKCDGSVHTLEEVGNQFNVTRERIRQIEAKALRKLRHPTRSRYLKDL